MKLKDTKLVSIDGYFDVLPPGIYNCTLEEVKHYFCQEIYSSEREEIFNNFENFTFFMKKYAGACYWINGSFVTSKIIPKDIDIVV
jgi:hypothetical protein